MTSSEYKNTIEWTLSVQTPKENDTLTTAKRILTNLGVPFPHGTLEEAVQILSTRNYMGWNLCNAAQAKYCANHGYTAIGVTKNSVVIILPEDEAVTVDNALPKVSHPAARKLSELQEEETADMQYFVYAILLEDLESMQGEHDVKVMAAATTTCSSCQGCNACQYVCERSCQTCNASCQSCNTCQGCNTCQDNCQVSCQTCNVGCQSCNTCNSCQTGCQTNNHTWGEWTVVKAATCKSTGIMRRVCKSCSASEEKTIAINPNAHSWGTTIVYNKTHPHKGARTCKLCGIQNPNDSYAYTGSYPGCSFCTTLPAPTELTAGRPEKNSIFVSWNIVKGAAGYQLYRDDVLIYEGNKNQHYSFNYATGRTYTFKVRAYKDNVFSAFSELYTITLELTEPLLIYQTRETELNWFENDDSETETLRPDLLYADMTKEEIVNQTIVQHLDFLGNVDLRIADFKYMAKKLFASKEFDPIIEDMIDHFTGKKDSNFTGTIKGIDNDEYNIYENSELTNKVQSHEASIKYVNGVINALNECIKNNDNIDDLEYYPSWRFKKDLRKRHPIVSKLIENYVKQPVFNTNKTEGFTICIDALHGNKIEIVSYSLNGKNYSGTLQITYYDHFGLDVNDLANGYPSGLKDFAVDSLNGFRQWFILQHWNALNANIQPKPFVTMIRFEIPFSGTKD